VYIINIYQLQICRWMYLQRCSGVARGGPLGAQALGAHQHAFCSHLNTRFEQKFRPSILKNAYFLKKIKNNLSVEGSALDPPFASGGW